MKYGIAPAPEGDGTWAIYPKPPSGSQLPTLAELLSTVKPVNGRRYGSGVAASNAATRKERREA